MTDADGTPTPPPRRGIAKQVAWMAFAYVILLVLSAPLWFPPFPRSWVGWLAFLLFAPPLYVLGEWLGTRYAEPWWESSLFGKFAKAMLLIGFALVLMILSVLFGGP